MTPHRTCTRDFMLAVVDNAIPKRILLLSQMIFVYDNYWKLLLYKYNCGIS